MPAGTITLTNNSATVKGAGTAFTTELKPGDFVVAVVGGVTYTLPVKTVDNATQVTLIRVYEGPTQAGAAWSAVPRETQNLITAQLVAEGSRALRGLNYDKDNWQQVFSGTGNITVRLPDGSTFTGPAWNSFTAALNLKADRTELSKKANQTDLDSIAVTLSGALFKGNNLLDVPDKDAARKNLGLGSTNTVFFSGIACRQGVNGGFGSNKFNLFWNTQSQLEAWVDSTRVGGVTLFTISSDKGLKRDIIYMDDNEVAYAQVAKWKVAKFKYKERGIIPQSDETLGFIANDLVRQSPECVQGEGLPEDYDIEKDPNNPNAYVLNQIALTAKLTQALQVAMRKIDALENYIINPGVINNGNN
ncbi:tail fiber domain-containing protein [Serratia fonticola]|uniref:tail fiber domain-containing protein n=1 Tax=Serratia fonticola TaxID=47917 RepID=UPI0015C5FA83|nr:tail fiber domain-containing protein [Serratia fonticola]NXZ87034.1 tail fiber domain-containing protein [Serratia fonticola]